MKLTVPDRRWLNARIESAGTSHFTGKSRLEPFLYRAYDNNGRGWLSLGFQTESEAREALKLHAERIVTTPKRGVHQKIYARQADSSYEIIEHVIVTKLVEEVPDLLYYKDAYDQAEKTLRILLTMYGDHPDHETCGLICKINEIEGLLETM